MTSLTKVVSALKQVGLTKPIPAAAAFAGLSTELDLFLKDKLQLSDVDSVIKNMLNEYDKSSLVDALSVCIRQIATRVSLGTSTSKHVARPIAQGEMKQYRKEINKRSQLPMNTLYDKCGIRSCTVCAEMVRVLPLSRCSNVHKGTPCLPCGIFPHATAKVIGHFHYRQVPLKNQMKRCNTPLGKDKRPLSSEGLPAVEIPAPEKELSVQEAVEEHESCGDIDQGKGTEVEGSSHPSLHAEVEPAQSTSQVESSACEQVQESDAVSHATADSFISVRTRRRRNRIREVTRLLAQGVIKTPEDDALVETATRVLSSKAIVNQSMEFSDKIDFFGKRGGRRAKTKIFKYVLNEYLKLLTQ